ncbi:MAG TPA: YceH family protein [Gaiellaceae bacterium]|jgi:hypothetical protein|nr:YceH family protein [Gaiellaceae bacterium]
MVHRLSPVELRVLGCLIEKQRATPEQYPLTLNSLRLACNQATNREPVLELDESEVRAAAQQLGTKGYARLATGPGSRTAKYRQLFQEALDLLPDEVSILAVLFLRGPQTVSELKTRTARLANIEDVHTVLDRLDRKELVHLLPKQPGQREERWTHLLAEGPTGAGPIDEPEEAVPAGEPTTLEQRLARVEAQVEELTRRLAERGLLD